MLKTSAKVVRTYKPRRKFQLAVDPSQMIDLLRRKDDENSAFDEDFNEVKVHSEERKSENED